MTIRKILIANRGEIAIRIARTARQMDMQVIGLYAEDDAASSHLRFMDEAVAMKGLGPGAYLDIDQVMDIAKEYGVEALHPGYGFLSENAELARACEQEDVIFVGPRSETLSKLSDKSQARALALENGVPVLAGLNEAVTVAQAKEFFTDLAPGSQMFIKAIAGGGGRGMRLVSSAEEIEAAYESASREAEASFGNGDLYVERFMPNARHIEIQILGDGTEACHLFERECSLQRRNQKLIEIAPAPNLDQKLREELCASAVKLAKQVGYRGLGTFEFLVSGTDDQFAFIEANPRIQVEHTVTEEWLGLDLVALQLSVCAGETIKSLSNEISTDNVPGYAIQCRVNAEEMQETGDVRPSGGEIQLYEVPQGPGVRIDGAGVYGWKPNPRYDSLLAKVIVHEQSSDFGRVVKKAERALSDFLIAGLTTNIPFLRSLLESEAIRKEQFSTKYVDENYSAIYSNMPEVSVQEINSQVSTGQADNSIPDGMSAVEAPLLGTVSQLLVKEGDLVKKGDEIIILDAMKMEHVICAEVHGCILEIRVQAGDTVDEAMVLMIVEPTSVIAEQDKERDHAMDVDFIRPDLEAILKKQNAILDDARPEAVAKRHSKGKSMIRENIARLVDQGSFSEYGGLNLAAQRSRHSIETLEKISPADGMVAGTASINGEHFEGRQAACMVLGYDYTVFAGTQGAMNHKKTDRLLHIAEERQLPIIFYGEGGGGRPGDVDLWIASTLDVPTFQTYARLSGLVPRIGVASGRCFAGNAALMGVSDILIATKDITIGMGGPAMIEGGGLGVFTPEEVGPISVQSPNGVIDIVVEDEVEATEVAKKVMSYFQGKISSWEAHDQRRLRSVIPENRLRVYEVRDAIELIADVDSVQEIRPDFASGMITGFMRIEGQPLGFIANNPKHLGGAIDADGSEKAARHIQLCDAFDIPLLTFCDTPGFMVGPEAEKTALVRKTARLFAAAGSITVPVFTVILRKGYGLGAQAMAGGSMHAPFLCVSWPTGEMGPMGLEGAVRLGFKKELEAAETDEARQALFEKLVAKSYAAGKAENAAAYMEIDDVIDPAETRNRLAQAIRAAVQPQERNGKKRTFVDTW